MNKVKELREQKGLTQSELGRVLNVKKSTVSKYENGSLDLNSTTIATLCDYFNVSANYLLNINEENLPRNNSINNINTEQYIVSKNTEPVLKEIFKRTSGMSKPQLEKILKIIEVFHDEETIKKNL